MRTYTCSHLFLVLLIGAAAHAQPSRTASAASYLSRGNDWLAKGELDRAIADYDLAIAFDSRVAVAFCNRCLARHRKGDLAKALSDCNRAIELNPRYSNAYLNRAAIHHQLSEFDRSDQRPQSCNRDQPARLQSVEQSRRGATRSK